MTVNKLRVHKYGGVVWALSVWTSTQRQVVISCNPHSFANGPTLSLRTAYNFISMQGHKLDVIPALRNCF